MSFQRVHQSQSQSPQASSSTSQFAPRPFSVQEPKRLPTQEHIESEAFQQNKFEAFGLQLKEKSGTITPVEQERLGVFQAKMDDIWAQRMERAKTQPNLLEILIRNSQTAQITKPTTPAQPNAIQAQVATTGDRPDSSVERHPNKTGMPDALKAGVESLSGYSLDDVRVHYNSPKPNQLQALAYTQGTEIYVASGQEEHLPHEAWHVVQQLQGRVKPTMQLKDGVSVNDDAGLEHEADVMGSKVWVSGAQLRSVPDKEDGFATKGAPVQKFALEAQPALSLIPMASAGQHQVAPPSDTATSATELLRLNNTARPGAPLQLQLPPSVKPIQRLILGENGQLDTRDSSQIDAVVAELMSLDYDSLLYIREMLDPENDSDQGYIKLINYEIGKADALKDISDASYEHGGIFTSATIFVNGQLTVQTEPVSAIDDSTTHYQYVLGEMATETEMAEEHNSRNDSEVGTLEKAYDAIDGLKAHFNAATQVRIILVGTSGPCDGCKQRVETFRDDVLDLLPGGAILSIDSSYLNSTSRKERNDTETRYGYEDQSEQTSARGDRYYNYRFPLKVKQAKRKADGAPVPLMAYTNSAISLAVQREEQPSTKRARGRELESDDGTLSDVVQLKVDNSRSSIGRRIIITDHRASDYRQTGTIRRFSYYGKTLFAVEFDNERGCLYRVDYRDMDYYEDSGSSRSESEGEQEDQGMWVSMDGGEQYQNCTDFAFEGHFELVLQADLKELLAAAERNGYARTDNDTEATVVLYGRGGDYSHAIRKVAGVWQEVQSLGGSMRYYTGGANPPAKHTGDVIVARLRKL